MMCVLVDARLHTSKATINNFLKIFLPSVRKKNNSKNCCISDFISVYHVQLSYITLFSEQTLLLFEYFVVVFCLTNLWKYDTQLGRFLIYHVLYFQASPPTKLQPWIRSKVIGGYSKDKTVVKMRFGMEVMTLTLVKRCVYFITNWWRLKTTHSSEIRDVWSN